LGNKERNCFPRKECTDCIRLNEICLLSTAEIWHAVKELLEKDILETLTLIYNLQNVYLWSRRIGNKFDIRE
jgi:hypothetical protein